ncbi:MAG: VWA domain-containing protein [Dehalococcoidia bacterium]
MLKLAAPRTIFAIAAAIGIASILLSAPSARAQEAPSLAINQLDATGYPDMSVLVTVLDAGGVPVPGLAPDQFQAVEGSDLVDITNIQPVTDASLPLSVVVVIDTSGSMQGEPIARAKQAATDFINALGPNDQAAVFSFSGTTVPVVPLTGDRAALAAGIASLQAVGPTALYEAVQAGVFAARASGAPRQAVVILSDGENDSESPITEQGSLDAAFGGGVPVFTIGLGAAPAGYLQTLAAATRGQYREATAGNIAEVYAEIAAMLRGQYVLTLHARGDADGAASSMQLIVSVAGAPAGASIDFTRGTAAAPPPPPRETTQPQPATEEDSGGANVALEVYAGIVAAVVLAGLVVFLFTWSRRARLRRAQMQIVAPNVAQAAKQPLPPPRRAVNDVIVHEAPPATGRLVEVSANGSGRVLELGAETHVIGSSPELATIVLPEGDGVAPDHAHIWLRDGGYVLHHAAGPGRKTYVGGRLADWVILEPGDEIRVGSHRFVFEDPTPVAPRPTLVERPTVTGFAPPASR